jgi:membrane protein
MPSRPSSFSRPISHLGSLIWETIKAYFEDNVSRLGAALAFYTTFAVAPLLVLAVALASIIFDEATARERVIGEIEQMVGSQASQAIRTVEPPVSHTGTTIATIIGVGTLVVGALGVFVHLQDALNVIWRVKPRDKEPWWMMVKRRLFSLAMVTATGFILLVSLIVSAALSWVGEHAVQRLGWPEGTLQALNFILSFAVITFLFAMVFKLLPDAEVRWNDVWLGAVATALLFNLGKMALSWYLSRASVMSSYGVAGSLIALLLWVYYAAQIVFIGAEFTRVHADARGGGAPAPHAKPAADPSDMA